MGEKATTSHEADVIVVGGGPAGSTIASLLAERRWRVALVERERHPRFHIGESLLPMNLPIFERLGVLDQVAAIGVKKHGADFSVATSRSHISYPFAHALGGSPGHAFQVHRAELDELLFRHAEARGVTGYEGVGIQRLSLDDDRVVAEGQDDTRTPVRFTGRYLVDASGRGTLVGRQLGVTKSVPRRKSAALFAHFRGVTRTPSDELGHIVVHRIDRGWAWLIPLTGGVSSIGVVCEPARVACPADQLEHKLRSLLDQAPHLAERLAAAEIVGEPGRASNYSYRHERIAGRRWIMVGDAFGFLDPVFSSGVFLAMKSAELATDVIHDALRHPDREARLQADYAKTVREAYDAFEWFVERFNSDAMDLLFQQPNNQAGIVQAIISMLAGDVIDAPAVRRRLFAFKVIYNMTQIDVARIHLTDSLLGRSGWNELTRDQPPRTFAP